MSSNQVDMDVPTAAATLANPVLNPECRTDVENGRRFVREHGEVVRYVSTWNQWLIWDRHRWKPDEAYAVEALAKRTSDQV